MKRFVILIPAIIAVVFTVGCKPSVPDTLVSEIAFISSMENDGAFDIYVISLPSMETRQLTHVSGANVENIWLNWDVLNRLVYASTRDGNYELYMIDTDDTLELRLTENEFFDGYPSVSPDGKTIAFSSAPPPRGGIPRKDIYLLDVQTEEVTQLTKTPDNEETHIRWSPDGTMLCYVTYVMGQPDIFVYDVASGLSVNLTDHPADDFNPCWTPDGQIVVFSSNRNDTLTQASIEKRFSIFAMDAYTGESITALLDDEKWTYDYPALSRDGEWLAFTQKKMDVMWERMWIAVMNLREKKIYMIVKNDFFNKNPVWRSTSVN